MRRLVVLAVALVGGCAKPQATSADLPDADAFRIERNPHHLGFGIGSHFCMGANLARMEMRVVFEEILRRLPDMEYAGDGPVIRPSALVRTCEEMKVRYTPEGQIADAA